MRHTQKRVRLLWIVWTLLLPYHQVLADPAGARTLPSTSRSTSDDSAGSVTLPLDQYRQLIERVERAEDARQKPAELEIAELTRQATTVKIEGSTARLFATYEVRMRGRPSRPVGLPVTGLIESALLEPSSREAKSDAALHRKGRELLLIAPRAGGYTVEVESLAELENDGGVSRLELAESKAGVATVTLDLPADVAWTCERAVVVGDEVAGERRRLLLAPDRGSRAVLELRRAAEANAAEQTRARTVVVTVARLGGARLERYDMVLYEVSRGELDRFEVDVPGGLEVTRTATDEGSALSMLDGRRLTVERQRRLAETGHLTLVYSPWRLPAGDPAGVGHGVDVPLPRVEPAVPVRSRYLVLATDRAADVEPLPLDAWNRVDLQDLPDGIRSRVAALDVGSVWRWREAPESVRLRVAPHEPITPLETVVRRRSTTTLLSVDGALVHRDRFTVSGAAAFELSLPASARLWSAKVDNQAVRPIEQGGMLVVPLGYKAGDSIEIEVVAVEERRVERGKSRLEVAVPRVAAPVIEHQWRLLLPENDRFRLVESDLLAAPPGEETPHRTARVAIKPLAGLMETGGTKVGIVGQIVDDSGAALPGTMVSVTGANVSRIALADEDGRFAIVKLPAGTYRIVAQLDGFNTVETVASVPAGRTAQVDLTLPLAAVIEELIVTAERPAVGWVEDERDEVELAQRRWGARRELSSLRQGLVGGVKPLAVELPESGKLLLLAGVLPPPSVGVELEVRAKR